MSDCIPTAELAALRELPPDHPRRRHVESCARCRAQWLLYLDFAAASTRMAPPARPAVRRWWPAPVALAAVLAGVALLNREAVLPGHAPVAVLRGEAAPAAPRLEPARVAADGAVVLRWRAVAGASGYRVHLLSRAGETLFASALLPDTTLTLTREALPEPARTGGPVAWRVGAVTEDGEVVSAPGLIE